MSETERDQDGQVRKSGSRSGWVWLLVMPAVGGLLGYFSGAVRAYVAPKKFESVTVLQILHPSEEGGLVSARPELRSSTFFATEFEIITAEETLKRVVERLDLDSRWKQESSTVVDILQAITETERIRHTDLVEIRVRHTNAADARDVAKAVAEAYMERRKASALGRAQVALDALDVEIRDQEDLVAEKRKVLDTIVQAIGIPYVEGQHGESEIAGVGEVYQAERKKLVSLELEIKQVEAQFAIWAKLDTNQLLDQFVQMDPAPEWLRDIRHKFLTEQAELRILQAQGLGESHPDMVKQEAVVGAMGRELEIAVNAQSEAQKIRLKVMKGRAEAMRAAVNELRDESVDRSLESHDFVEAKGEYEGAATMLHELKLKHSSRRISLRIPRNSVVVHEQAKVGRTPVSPKVAVLLATGLWIGIAVGSLLGVIFFWMGRLRSREA